MKKMIIIKMMDLVLLETEQEVFKEQLRKKKKLI